MFDDLPPDLERLRTLRVWHALWMERIDRKIAALERRQAEQERGRRERPRPPDWLVELGIGTGQPPVQVHAGDCRMAGKRRRAVSRDEARRLLATGLRACSHCQPDARLNILDLPAPAAARRGGDAAQHRPVRPDPRQRPRRSSRPSLTLNSSQGHGRKRPQRGCRTPDHTRMPVVTCTDTAA
ncbi:DUF6233 domain-containing protein [Streptomyces sp. NPDC004533]|uniref:DUF6233 domain-containing protein n=1 Tax=Streptomyces sp. NPDC004533 TaxID=3154278 RepID=UPI0033B283DF